MFNEDTDQELDELIRRSAQMEMPNQVETRLRARLTEFRARVEQRRPSRFQRFADAILHPASFRVPAMVGAVLAAIALALVVLPDGSHASRAYAKAASQLRGARSLEYKLVLAPFTEIEISYLAPASRRINCSWGIEVRGDGSGRQLVMFHGTQQYLMEENKQTANVAGQEDLIEQLRSLPNTASSALGERQEGGRRLTGYRVNPAPFDTTFAGLKALDLWVNAQTGYPDHVDITVQEQGKPLYQMHITGIRVDESLNPSQFDMAPPVGYTAFPIPDRAGNIASEPGLKPRIVRASAMTAVVVPMKGSYLQAGAAVSSVALELTKRGVTPTGPAFGRFGSERDWDAGYPVPHGTRVDAPFQVVDLPEATVASAIVSGAWGRDSGSRWAAFLKWVVEQGYVPTGPAMEIWSGVETSPATQSTEMRMPVETAK